MRIERVRIQNFCGVKAAEVNFSSTGVTLIYGPNEAGKSTLMSALDILLEYRDDSKNADVKNTKPVNQDVGPEVEADIQIGDYRFTYFKRFIKDKKTELQIQEPHPENLTGREAHDRVSEILTGSVDTGLWKALRVLQGNNLQMPALKDQRALSNALDSVAGHAKPNEKESNLFEEVRKEFLQYYTEGTSSEKQVPLGQARARCAEASEKEQKLKTELAALETDIKLCATKEKTRFSLSLKISELEAAQQKAQESWNAVSLLTESLERARLEKNHAEQTLRATQSEQQRRKEMIESVSVLNNRLHEAQNLHDEARLALDEANTAIEKARSDRDLAAQSLHQSEQEEALKRSDLEFRTDEVDLLAMQQRFNRIADVKNQAAQAEALVASAKITESLRTKIREAEIQLKTELSVQNLASPHLTLTALEPVSVCIEGRSIQLKSGDTQTVTVKEPATVSIGALAEVRVEPGTSADALKQAVAAAENNLSTLCTKAGVTSPSEAEAVWAALVEAKRTIIDRDRIIGEQLLDLTTIELETRIQKLSSIVETYKQERASDYSVLPDINGCRARLDVARSAAISARNNMTNLQEVYDAHQEHHTACRETYAVRLATLEREQEDLARAVSSLDQARVVHSDEELDAQVQKATSRVSEATLSFQASVQKLEGVDPDAVKALLETSIQALSAVQEQLQSIDNDLIGLRTKLDIYGDKGLAESLSEASRIAFEAKDSYSRLLRRAEAVRLLFNTMKAERDAILRAYAQPLKKGIERLGILVFGPTFCVEVDDELQVVSRTLDAVTIPVKQLSNGAQEQLGLLTRLAAASMVSTDGSGVPLVLDDALGSTDQERLEAMGAVLRVASQNAQTIIITCSPERYVHVGAKVSVALNS